jgi:hypothetical protein
MNYLNQTPFWPNLAKLNYPPHLKKLITAAEKVWEVWAEADTARVIAEDNLTNAELDHAKRVKDAARSGSPLPDVLDTRALEDAQTYANEVCVMRRHEVSVAVKAMQDGFRKHRVELAHLAIDKAEAGIENYAKRMKAVAQDLADIEDERRAAYDGLMMMSDYTDPEIRFVPNFGSNSQTTLPRTTEIEAKNSIAAVQSMLDMIAKRGDTEEATDADS